MRMLGDVAVMDYVNHLAFPSITTGVGVVICQFFEVDTLIIVN